MAAMMICDQCGDQEKYVRNWTGLWFGPNKWGVEKWNPNLGHGSLYSPKTFCSLECASEFFDIPSEDLIEKHMSDDDYFDWVDSASDEELEVDAKRIYVEGEF